MSATLKIEPAPDIGPDTRYYEIDCEHGTTKALTDGAPSFPDPTIVAYLLARHDLAERCGCTAELHRRYGAAVAASHPGKG